STNLGAALTTGCIPAAPPATCRLRRSLTGRLNERAKSITKLGGIIRAEVDFVHRTIDSERDRLLGIATVDVVDQVNLDLLCHGIKPFRRAVYPHLNIKLSCMKAKDNSRRARNRPTPLRVSGRTAPREAFTEPKHATGAALHPMKPVSEEHTSELQSRFDLVCRLLLEKKKKHKQ